MDEIERKIEEDDKAIKTAYDGREYYQKSLSKLLEGMVQASLDTNYTLWLRQLRHALNLVGPYIGTKKESIKLEVDQVIKNYNMVSETSPGTKQRVFTIGVLENSLFTTTGDLIDASKHLLLPTREDDESGEIDIDGILGESG